MPLLDDATRPEFAGSPPGLTDADARARLAADGPNRLPEPPRRSRLALFLDQFRNLLVVILMGAAVLAGLVGDWKDTIVIGVVLLINAVLGYVQEGKAERSLAALRSMLVESAKVRRDGQTRVIPAEDLVVGDVVLVDTGDRIPADGRLVAAPALEVDESSLTGESSPVAKSTDPVAPQASLGDRTDSVFMNTTVTRGRAELEVTATGERTEIGKLAGMLAAADPGETPLQLQLHSLGKRLAAVAAIAVSAYVALELLGGAPLADTLLSAVALAVAAIPEGLPAVVTVTLAVGVHQLAKRGAIVKRLSSVETLGSTTVICSDKTGTLTLNRMTVQEVHTADRPRLLEAAVLCNDAVLRDGDLVGDPTEGALVILAADEGLDAETCRQDRPRRDEVPFDSATKVMVTVHDRTDGAPGPVAYVKGAPDVLLPRTTAWHDADRRQEIEAALDDMAARGLRVLAVAERPGDPDADLARADVDGLELLGLVGLLDPPRPEARDAIAVCHRAGIAVKMITGDHQATATAIARQLGIRGETLTGRDLDALDDAQLAAVVDDTGVFARVAPAHKVRLVEALRAKGHVVAMTGDGVNDAPALKTADIGVAMGITGTEVSKEAADMVLTDDDFSTIVKAVESGRTIYRNIVTFVRFQLSTNVGAILTLLGASVTGLPVPFTAIQVLWVNLIMDGPPAMALGVDPPSGRAMDEAPRRPGARILNARRLRHVVLAGVVMAVGTLGVLAHQRSVGTEEHALAMAFTTFVMFQIFNVFNARSEGGTVFSRSQLRNGKLWAALVGVVTLQVLAVHVDPVQDVFGTADLTAGDWLQVMAVASTVLWVEELRKLVTRARTRPAEG
jgi:Ca2+-transporting ATPase